MKKHKILHFDNPEKDHFCKTLTPSSRMYSDEKIKPLDAEARFDSKN